jgi:DNA mismatch endonuclease (patch repair protein)
MADAFDQLTRRRIMSSIRARNTEPELAVRHFLHSRGLRYRIHVKALPGKPDIVLRRKKTVVFVHGCFWHQHPGCRFAVLPKSNRVFWNSKLAANQRRDQLTAARLRRTGWRVFTIWECGLSDRGLERLYRKIMAPSRRRRHAASR